MMGVKIWRRAFRATNCSLLLLAVAAQAQELRDPTAPPTQATGASGGGAESSLAAEGTAVIVRDGKAGLVQGTRVLFPGQKWGRWTLERITETEVWLRDGAVQRKLQRFSGIQRTDMAAGAAACVARNAASAPAPVNPRKPTKKPPTSTPADTQCDAISPRSSNP